jgi:Leucine-rich repeat (LRR) protein
MEKLIRAYEALPKIPSILTRDELIHIYPNLQQEIIIDLSERYYNDIFPNTFVNRTFDGNLRNLEHLLLSNNLITKLQPGIFNNLANLKFLFLNNNQISEIQPPKVPSAGIFNNLSNLHYLTLSGNQIKELQPGIFNNLPLLYCLDLEDNQIIKLISGTFNNLPNLIKLYLENNQIE